MIIVTFGVLEMNSGMIRLLDLIIASSASCLF